MAESFTDRWRQREHACSLANSPSAIVRCGDVELPESAAPCLDFKEASSPLSMTQVFGGPEHWSPADRDRLAPYRMIGSDGAGNPICVEQASGKIVLLDHEDQFRTIQFVNSSAAQLAECLLAYMGETKPERFRSAVSGIDPSALNGSAFWWQEAANLGSA